jgi:molybdopterin-guanine dinucleotide biosynthesis protein A
MGKQCRVSKLFSESTVYDRRMQGARADNLTAFILAGGKSTRMGRDKAFINFNGRTLLSHALELARPLTSLVQIAGSREKFAIFGPGVEDIFPECGPLGGIHAALRASQTELNLMLAVDMPFVPLAFLQYLVEQAKSGSEAKAIVPRTEGRWQPLCAVYRRSFADPAEKALREGRNKIGSLLEQVEVRCIEEKALEHAGFSVDIFCNLNTPDELQALEQRT